MSPRQTDSPVKRINTWKNVYIYREKNAPFESFLPGFRRSACIFHLPRTEDFNFCAKSRSPESHSSPTGELRRAWVPFELRRVLVPFPSHVLTQLCFPFARPDHRHSHSLFPLPLAILIDISHGHFHREISVITLHIVAINGFCSWWSGSEGHDDGRHVGFTTTVHGGHTHGAPEAR